jgi:hypothetical protein
LKCKEPIILVVDAKQVLEDNKKLADKDKIEFYLEAINTYSVISLPAKYISRITK